jgi:hypothetical protein
MKLALILHSNTSQIFFEKMLYNQNLDHTLIFQISLLISLTNLFEISHLSQNMLILWCQARLWACGRGDTSTPSFGIYLNPISTNALPILISTPSFESHRRGWVPSIGLMSKLQILAPPKPLSKRLYQV